MLARREKSDDEGNLLRCGNTEKRGHQHYCRAENQTIGLIVAA